MFIIAPFVSAVNPQRGFLPPSKKPDGAAPSMYGGRRVIPDGFYSSIAASTLAKASMTWSWSTSVITAVSALARKNMAKSPSSEL